jgi:prepilin-type N-terminal cleavage/methylation domain-containing protein
MIKRLQAMKAKKGFTLVELIVVIAIIGVLAAILIPLLMNHVTSSRISAAESDASIMLSVLNAAQVEIDGRNGVMGLLCARQIVRTEMPSLVLPAGQIVGGAAPNIISLWSTVPAANADHALTGVMIIRVLHASNAADPTAGAVQATKDLRGRQNIWGASGAGDQAFVFPPALGGAPGGCTFCRAGVACTGGT